jgi:excisionase family DNA binding protein
MGMWRGSAGGAAQRRPSRALSTGQAAKYCLVSADTIANWIGDGRLAAQRTAGGQYRIRVGDLRCFMRSHGMRTDLLDVDSEHRPTCWEFFCATGQGPVPDGVSGMCAECPVYRSRAEVCHEVRPLLPGGTLKATSCAECRYLSTFMKPPLEEW